MRRHKKLLLTLTPEIHAALVEATEGRNRSAWVERLLARNTEIRAAADRIGVTLRPGDRQVGRPRKNAENAKNGGE